MAEEELGPAAREPELRFERSPVNAEVVHIIMGDKCASYWVRPVDSSADADWDWWAVAKRWPNLGYKPVVTGKGSEMCAQLKALELLGIKV